MKDFKGLLSDRINTFLGGFQERYGSLSDAEVKSFLNYGDEKAHSQARAVLSRTKQAMGFVAFS